MRELRRRGRRLLVASLGVAAVSYVGCKESVTNMPPGNLVAPPPASTDAAAVPVPAPAPSDVPMHPPGNLMPPPPTPLNPTPPPKAK